MKKIILLVLLVIMSTQIASAESYQRWIYWTKDSTHQVTATEMAQITVLLYEGKVSPNKEFLLTTGTALRIPQPALYLSYIEKAVRAASPATLTRNDIVFCLNDAEKMRWGNDISVATKNYYYSYVYKGVRSIDNYSGEGKNSDFLFINGNPAIKCDCGNPIEVAFYTERPTVTLTVEPPEPTKEYKPISDIPSFSYRRSLQQPQTEIFLKKRNGWVVPVIVIGGITVGIGVGCLIYSLCRHKSGEPGESPTTPSGGPGKAPTTP